MRNTIRQSIVLPAPAERLFEMYLDSELHQEIIGAPVSIGYEEGTQFSVLMGN